MYGLQPRRGQEPVGRRDGRHLIIRLLTISSSSYIMNTCLKIIQMFSVELLYIYIYIYTHTHFNLWGLQPRRGQEPVGRRDGRHAEGRRDGASWRARTYTYVDMYVYIYIYIYIYIVSFVYMHIFIDSLICLRMCMYLYS